MKFILVGYKKVKTKNGADMYLLHLIHEHDRTVEGQAVTTQFVNPTIFNPAGLVGSEVTIVFDMNGYVIEIY